MVRLGVNMARMAHKHGDPGLLQHHAEAGERDTYRGVLQRHVEAFYGTARKVLAALENHERESFGRPVAAAEVARIKKLVRQMGTIHYFRGILLEQEGVDPFEVIERGPAEGRLTSVIVLSYDQLDRTQCCLQALRDAADPRHPTELIVVDNGSTDGSAEWLAAQADVTLIANDHNVGAPAARNQALAIARGDYLVVMDNDAFVSSGWLHRLLHHAEVDGRVGCIGPVSDRAAHRQQIDYSAGSDPEAQRRFADALYVSSPGAAESRNVLSSFCLLFPRAVLDAIGGFDPRFSPWGYEDDDFTLRAAMAGFRNRIACDVFVRHESYGGEKADRHAELLLANWRRFAEKWGGDPDVPRGDNAGVESRMRARGGGPQLYVPLAAPRDGAPLGRNSATMPPTASTPTKPTTLNHKNSTLSVQ
jgi:GT2 family glycosyltransferase